MFRAGSRAAGRVSGMTLKPYLTCCRQRENRTTASPVLRAAFLVIGWAALVVAVSSCRAAGERSSGNKAPEYAVASSTLTKRPLSAHQDSGPSPAGAEVESNHSSGGNRNPNAALRLALEELTWSFNDTNLGRIDVVVVLPDRKPDQKFPLLVALHGRGEALKGPARGARGWVDDYALVRAMQRLSAPPLGTSDFEGIVTAQRLTTLNE